MIEVDAGIAIVHERRQADRRKGWIPPHRVSVVVPALNEAENLPFVLPRIPTWVHEVVLVDGNSTDGTVEVARCLWPTIRVVTQEGRGKGAALRSGFAAVTGEIIVMLDADGSTDPAEIPSYVGALLAGAEFVKGSRFLQGGGTADMSLHRKLGNAMFKYLVRMLFGSQYTDLCYGYNAFWTRTVQRLKLNGDGFEIETMMNIRAIQAGMKITEVASFEAPRVHGVGRLRTFPDGWRVLKTIWHEWRFPVVFKDGVQLAPMSDPVGISLQPELFVETTIVPELPHLTLLPDATLVLLPEGTTLAQREG